MSYASTLPLRSLRSSPVAVVRQRPSSWQRFLDALERLSLDAAPSKAAVAYAHALRAKPIPPVR